MTRCADGHCVTCSDEGVPMQVVETRPGALAICTGEDGDAEVMTETAPAQRCTIPRRLARSRVYLVAQRRHCPEHLPRPAHTHDHLVALGRYLRELHPPLNQHIQDPGRVALVEEIVLVLDTPQLARTHNLEQALVVHTLKQDAPP